MGSSLLQPELWHWSTGLSERLPWTYSLNLSRCTYFIECLFLQPDLWHQSAGFSERLPWLTSLGPRDSSHISDIRVQALASGCRGLAALGLRYCSQNSDIGVQASASGCPALTR